MWITREAQMKQISPSESSPLALDSTLPRAGWSVPDTDRVIPFLFPFKEA